MPANNNGGNDTGPTGNFPARSSDDDEGGGKILRVSRRTALGGLLGFGLMSGTAAGQPDKVWKRDRDAQGHKLTNLDELELIDDPVISSTDGTPLDLRLNGERALRLAPTPAAAGANLVGGHPSNSVAAGVHAATIAGGGFDDGSTVAPNTVHGDFGTVSGGRGNTVSGAFSTVSGGHTNRTPGNLATIGGGRNNVASGRDGVVAGGSTNKATGNRSTVGGGGDNEAAGENATVGGGISNRALVRWATIGGGQDNEASGPGGATVGGGQFNKASRFGTTVGGGSSNEATRGNATVGGGFANEASGLRSTVGGGEFNDATDTESTVGGGSSNVADGEAATVGGGEGNVAEASYATVGGGARNIVDGEAATVGGGEGNVAEASYATVGGGGPELGRSNAVYDDYGTIGGGSRNTVGFEGMNREHWNATIAGGDANTATGRFSTVGGGFDNDASGTYATIPGGDSNTADGHLSVATGRFADTNGHKGAFVIADSSLDGIKAQNDDEVRSQMPMYAPSFNTTSARAEKEHIEPVEPGAVLDAVTDLDVSTWQFKENGECRHMGPMAGEFADAFGLGDDEESIATVDADGVALAAIQGVAEKLHERDAKLDEEADRIATLEAENKQLRERLRAVEAHVGVTRVAPDSGAAPEA